MQKGLLSKIHSSIYEIPHIFSKSFRDLYINYVDITILFPIPNHTTRVIMNNEHHQSPSPSRWTWMTEMTEMTEMTQIIGM